MIHALPSAHDAGSDSCGVSPTQQAYTCGDFT